MSMTTTPVASKPLSPKDVARLYRMVLQREPESDRVVAIHAKNFQDPLDLAEALLRSDEFQTRRPSPPAPAPGSHPHTTSLDIPALLRRFAAPNLPQRAHCVTDFVGSLTDTRFLPKSNRPAGVVEGIPLVQNFHADSAEWGAAMRAVSYAKETFTAVELGAGWAPWLVSCALAAIRTMGVKKTFGVAVEADEEHLGFARDHFRTNGFADSDRKLIHGVAAPKTGYAVFPIPDDSASDWGMRPIFVPSREEGEKLIASGAIVDYRGQKFKRGCLLPSVSCADALADCEKVDLLHIDIQGEEADFIAENLDLIAERVNYLVVGTHTRSIEGRLISMLEAKWRLEVEKPCQFQIQDRRLLPSMDGVQGWRNARLPANP